MLALLCVTPPALSVTVPTTIFIMLIARRSVHCAAVKTHRLERIAPPQKCKLVIVRRDAMNGTWPKVTAAPPTTLPSISSTMIAANKFFLYFQSSTLKYYLRVPSTTVAKATRPIILKNILTLRQTSTNKIVNKMLALILGNVIRPNQPKIGGERDFI